MSPKNEPTTSNPTDGNVSPPEDQADDKRLQLNKQTLQDLSATGVDDDKVRGGAATIRRCD